MGEARRIADGAAVDFGAAYTGSILQPIDSIALVSPARILFFKANHKIDNLLCDGRSTSVHSVLRSIIFFSYQFLIPTHDSVYREQFCAPLQHFPTEPLGLRSHPHSLAIG